VRKERISEYTKKRNEERIRMKRIHVVCGGKGREKEANGIAMRQVARPLIWRLHLQAFSQFLDYQQHFGSKLGMRASLSDI